MLLMLETPNFVDIMDTMHSYLTCSKGTFLSSCMESYLLPYNIPPFISFCPSALLQEASTINYNSIYINVWLSPVKPVLYLRHNFANVALSPSCIMIFLRKQWYRDWREFIKTKTWFKIISPLCKLDQAIEVFQCIYWSCAIRSADQFPKICERFYFWFSFDSCWRNFPIEFLLHCVSHVNSFFRVYTISLSTDEASWKRNKKLFGCLFIERLHIFKPVANCIYDFFIC